MKDKESDDAPDAPKEKPRPSMLDLAKKLDAAIRDADAKRDAMAAAQTALDGATKDYTAAVEGVTALHAQFEEFMHGILTFGGTAHVANA